MTADLTVRRVAAHAAPIVAETTLLPMAVWFAVLALSGMGTAIAATLGVSALIFARRVVCGARIPGALVLGLVDIGIKATVVLAGGPDAGTRYFSLPVLITVATATAFGVSALTGRPLVARLGGDYIPVPSDVWTQPGVRAACQQASVVWMVALLANAALTLTLIDRLGVTTYSAVRLTVPLVTTLPALLASTALARRTPAWAPA